MVRIVRDNGENPGLKLEVSRKSQIRILSEILIFGPLFLAWVPGVTKFVLDGAWILLVCLAGKGAVLWYGKGTKGLVSWALCGLLFFGAVYLFRYQRGAYFLWGVRNNFRFYAAFFGFLLLEEAERESIWRGLERLFWANFLLVLVQFFFFGRKGDFLGGFFGTEKGCNGGLNLFLLVLVGRSLSYMEEKPGYILAKCGVSLLIAAMAELKFFFVEFAVLLVLTGFQGKKIVLFGAILALAGGVALMERCFPKFAGWMGISSIWETAADPAGYASTGDLNRLNAISEVNRRVFLSGWDQIFGLGLGNCDVSSFSFLTTPFSKWYDHLHYSWMSHAFWYLEGGWLGLLFFFGFFWLILLGSREKFSRNLAVLCLFIGIYNASLRTEAAFLMYFGLSEGIKGRK